MEAEVEEMGGEREAGDPNGFIFFFKVDSMILRKVASLSPQ